MSILEKFEKKSMSDLFSGHKGRTVLVFGKTKIDTQHFSSLRSFCFSELPPPKYRSRSLNIPFRGVSKMRGTPRTHLLWRPRSVADEMRVPVERRSRFSPLSNRPRDRPVFITIIILLFDSNFNNTMSVQRTDPGRKYPSIAYPLCTSPEASIHEMTHSQCVGCNTPATRDESITLANDDSDTPHEKRDFRVHRLQ